MIEQRYIDILNEQRQDLLDTKKNINFFRKLFFRKYTDWIVTDKVKYFSRQEYITDYYETFKSPVGKPRNITKQVELRMRLKDGQIEINEFEV